MELYGVPRFESSHDFLLKLAASKGKLKRVNKNIFSFDENKQTNNQSNIICII